jgi:hypothetical protein
MLLLVSMYTGKKAGRQQLLSELKTAKILSSHLRRRQAKRAVECTLGTEESAFQKLTDVRFRRRSDGPLSAEHWYDVS